MSMTRKKIQDAKDEAKAFIESCELALIRLTDEKLSSDRRYANYDGPTPPPGPAPDDYSFGSKETGALKRKSIDLTRTLANLRK